MCGVRLAPGPCWNSKCPHNLFWEKLKLHADKIHITKKALEIGNCCCLINKPWAVEEIEAVWGLARAEIRRFEATAWKKIYRRNGRGEVNRSIFHNSIRSIRDSIRHKRS
jgi:hypothetical protein